MAAIPIVPIAGKDGGASGYDPGATPTGVWGDSGSGYGVYGASGHCAGVKGDCSDGVGVTGAGSDSGVVGFSTSGQGVYGGCGYGGVAVYGNATQGGLAGKFDGAVVVNGDLTVNNGTLTANNVSSSVKQFKIDHPLDPENKYLVHASVESAEMMNIYNGNVALDGGGEAVVELPQWFEALNQDFRYQLTPIGAPGPNLYVKEKIRGSRFRIAGGRPGMEVSWQVTGIRHDVYAAAHRSPVEQEKAETERGFYLHPELFGQPAEKGVEWARRPELMRRMKAEAEKTSRSLPYPDPVIPDAARSMLESAPSGE